MAVEEKWAWVGLIVSITAYVVYLVVVLGRAAGGSLPETPYVDVLLWTIGAAIIVAIVVTIVVSILSGKDGLATDQRDKQISARAEFTSRGFLIAGALAALIFAMLEWDYFWIANVIYLGFFLSSVLEGITKIALYRGGMPAW